MAASSSFFSFPPFLFLLCTFLLMPISDSVTALPLQKQQEQQPRGLVFPVSLSIDLGGENFWVDCSSELYVSSSYKSTRCGSKLCNKIGGGCQDCYGGPRPGCNKKACTIAIRNRMTDHLVGAEVAEDVFAIQSMLDNNGSSSSLSSASPGILVSVAKMTFA